MILQSIETPADIKDLSHEQLLEVAEEIRSFIIDSVTTTGGHLGSNLGAVELTLAMHRVFDSPRDVILCTVCWRSHRQNFFISMRSRSFSLFLVVM